jgi:hypothetical protein
MGESLAPDVSIEKKQPDPNKMINEIYQRMRGRDGVNNLINAIEEGGKTIPILNYENDKDDKEFPPDEPTERDNKYSEDLTFLLNEKILENARRFKKIKAKAAKGEADVTDAEFAAEYEQSVKQIYDELREMGYSHNEIWA